MSDSYYSARMDLPTQLTITRKQLKELTEEYQFLEQTSSQQTDQLARSHQNLAQAVAIASAFATALLTHTSPPERPFDEAQRLSAALQTLLPVIDEDPRYDDMNTTRTRLSAALSELSAGRERFSRVFEELNASRVPPKQETPQAVQEVAPALLLEACDQLKLALKESTDQLFSLDQENQQLRNENTLLRRKVSEFEDKCSNQIVALNEDILRQQNVIAELIKVCDAISK